MDLTTTNSTLITPAWTAPPSVFAYSTTRIGGVSEGIYCGLNVGDHVGDTVESVAHNRASLPMSRHIHWLQQVHSNLALALPSKDSRGDASFTSSPNVACAVMTADCVPILMTNNDGSTVAAIHAGLKGLQTHIIANTIERAFATSNTDLMAWIGPHISVRHYELSECDSQAFSTVTDAILPSTNPGKVMLDLAVIAIEQLKQMGVDHIAIDGRCTYEEELQFFSYRRARHQNKANCGRMVSVIAIKENV